MTRFSLKSLFSFNLHFQNCHSGRMCILAVENCTYLRVYYSYSPSHSFLFSKLAEKVMSRTLLSPSSPFKGGHVTRERSQITLKRGLAVTVPTYPFTPAHRTSVPGSMGTLQASTSLPTQQGRTGQTPGLCCDWHTTSLQGKCPGNTYCQNLGNKQRARLWRRVQIKTVLPTH